MSNPTLKTNNSKLEIRDKEPSDGAPPTSGIGGPSSDRLRSNKKQNEFIFLFVCVFVYCITVYVFL